MQDTPPIEITASAVCDALGRKEMAARLERTVAAVSNAASEGAFPPGWYLVISEMCRVKGIECPARLFRFRTPQTPEPSPIPPSNEAA